MSEKKKKGFSLLEILIALVVLSVLLVAFAPLLTKKKNVVKEGSGDATVDTAAVNYIIKAR